MPSQYYLQVFRLELKRCEVIRFIRSLNILTYTVITYIKVEHQSQVQNCTVMLVTIAAMSDWGEDATEVPGETDASTAAEKHRAEFEDLAIFFLNRRHFILTLMIIVFRSDFATRLVIARWILHLTAPSDKHEVGHIIYCPDLMVRTYPKYSAAGRRSLMRRSCRICILRVYGRRLGLGHLRPWSSFNKSRSQEAIRQFLS